jgi:hypothetical protein
MNEQFIPFANDTQSTTLFSDNGQGITFENNLESIIIYGDFSISKENTKVSDIDELISLLENIKKNITQ